jgi:medium-chain acyl-[acyl-carrier-protein] hydrolase
MSDKEPPDLWVHPFQPRPAAPIRLFCFPYAGGGPFTFRPWVNKLPDFVEILAIQLPGRGRRFSEPAITRLENLVPVLTEALLPYFDRTFVFFGHSMGATIAFEVARHLRRESKPQPAHLFVSGSPAPHLPDRHKRTYDLPEPQFIQELERLNGTPAEVLERPELMQLMLPILRADFELVETYVYREEPTMPVPLDAFGGLGDVNIPRQDIESWREHTCSFFSLRMLPGDHFFIHTHQNILLQAIAQSLARSTA